MIINCDVNEDAQLARKKNDHVPSFSFFSSLPSAK
jgi:hypothetical protein